MSHATLAQRTTIGICFTLHQLNDITKTKTGLPPSFGTLIQMLAAWPRVVLLPTLGRRGK